MGDDAVHRGVLGRIPPQGGLQADREATSDRTVRSVDIHSAGVNDDRSGTSGGGELCLLPP